MTSPGEDVGQTKTSCQNCQPFIVKVDNIDPQPGEFDYRLVLGHR